MAKEKDNKEKLNELATELIKINMLLDDIRTHINMTLYYFNDLIKNDKVELIKKSLDNYKNVDFEKMKQELLKLEQESLLIQINKNTEQGDKK